jgi:hypothetical protein
MPSPKYQQPVYDYLQTIKDEWVFAVASNSGKRYDLLLSKVRQKFPRLTHLEADSALKGALNQQRREWREIVRNHNMRDASCNGTTVNPPFSKRSI